MATRCYSILIAFLAIFAIASEACSNDLFRRVAEMVNDERQKVGLVRLTYNKQLEQAALSHSQWMARVQKMEHLQGTKPPDGFEAFLNSDHHHATRILKTGYLKWQDLFEVTREGNTGHINPKPDADDRVSEIIAYAGPGTGNVPKQLPIVVPGWMKSPGHRAVIVKTCWKEIGAAFAFAKDGGTYYAVTFGQKVEYELRIRPYRLADVGAVIRFLGLFRKLDRDEGISFSQYSIIKSQHYKNRVRVLLV